MVLRKPAKVNYRVFLLTIESHQRGTLTLNFKVWRGAFKNIETSGMGYC